jgi:hypothetical protein
MTTVRCPIWNTEAEELAKHYDDLKVDSPRAGGIYRISGTAAGTVKAKTPAERARLTTWIVDQRRSGVEAPHVTDDVIREAVSRRPLSTSARLQRFFLLALARDLQPTGTFKVAGIVDEKYLDDAGAIAAWTECRANEEVADLLRLLQEEGLVTDGQVKKLPPVAVGVLQGIERIPGNDYVIAGKIPGQYLTDLQHPWRRIRARAGLHDVRIHDIRHSFASRAAERGHTLTMIGKLLGHKTVQSTARYAHLADDPVHLAALNVSADLARDLDAGNRRTHIQAFPPQA